MYSKNNISNYVDHMYALHMPTNVITFTVYNLVNGMMLKETVKRIRRAL